MVMGKPITSVKIVRFILQLAFFVAIVLVSFDWDKMFAIAIFYAIVEIGFGLGQNAKEMQFEEE